MSKKPPGYELTNNPHGFIQFGPHTVGGNAKTGSYQLREGTNKREVSYGESLQSDDDNFTLGTAGGYYLNTLQNGNKIEVTPGKNEEVCGYRIDSQQKGAIAKALVAKQGDIHIVAENGSIHLKAKNIFIESSGSDNNGVVNIAANGAITVTSGERVFLGGTKICIRGQSGIDLATEAFVKVLGQIKESQPLSPLSFLNPAQLMDSLIQELTNTCR